jgi:sugar phosphate isomerase/epimerase
VHEADTVHPRLSVSTVGLAGGPLVPLLDGLAAGGIPRVGLAAAQVEAAGVAAVAAALRSSGLAVSGLVQPLAFTLLHEARWAAERERLVRALDIAAELDGPVLYTTTGPAPGLSWDEAVARFTAAIAPVAEQATERGVVLAIENTTTIRADLGFAHMLSDTADAARAAGIRVCADLFSAWTDRGLEQTVRRHGAEFALVQVADFVLGTRQSPDRAVPGEGHIPVRDQLGWLAASGYAGPVEIELIGPRIDVEGLLPAALRAARAVSRWLP